jgi:hypothetical protein
MAESSPGGTRCRLHDWDIDCLFNPTLRPFLGTKYAGDVIQHHETLKGVLFMSNDPNKKDNPQQNPQHSQQEPHPGHNPNDPNKRRPAQGNIDEQQERERNRQRQAS